MPAWALLWGLAATAGAEVFPYDVHSRTLPNGLVVHVVPMNSPGVATFVTWMAVGSRDEVEPGRTGYAHFFEHLMFYGTPTLGRAARELEIKRLGAEDNAWTWFDETVYHTTVSTAGLPRLIEIQGDLFRNLALTPDDVRKEAGAVYGEYRKGRSDPDWRIEEALNAAAFTTHTYRHDTIGLEADIAAMPDAYAWAMSFFDRYYRPNHAFLIVAGDVQPEPTFAAIEASWGAWASGTEARAPIPAEPKQTEARRREVPWSGPTAPRIAMGFKIPGSRPDDPDVAALQLAADWLFAPTGPLRRRLVEEEKLAWSVSGGRDDFVDPSLFRIVVEARDRDDLPRIEAIVREELARLEQGVDADTLARVRSHERYAFLTALDEPPAVADALGWAIRRGGSPDAIDRFFAAYDAVTPEAVSAAARRYFVDSGLTVVTLVPEEAK